MVGLFAASSVVLLAALVDECCDPSGCEYALARMGGMMVMNVTSARWPRTQDDDSATGFEDAVLSQQWQDDLGHGGSLEWKPLGPAVKRLLRSAKRRPHPKESPIA